MLSNYAENRYKEAKKFATKTGQLESLEKAFDHMRKKAEHSIVNIFEDFAPLSFYFTIIDENDNNKLISNGGIIYHGELNNSGEGGSPTFSVCTTPTTGWQIHT